MRAGGITAGGEVLARFVLRSRALMHVPLKRGALTRVALSCAALLLITFTPAVQAYEADKVVIVMLDGPRLSETFEDPAHLHVPRMWNDLLPQSAHVPEFRNDGSTYTLRGFASVLTGTWQHIPNDGSTNPTMPTLFEYYRHATGAAATDVWIVGGKWELEVMVLSSHPSYGAQFAASASCVDRPDDLTFADYRDRLTEHHPTLSMLALTDIDEVAHVADWEGYLDRIAHADSLVMELWSWLQADPVYAGRTAMIVTQDHGRHLDDWTTHGDSCEGCRRLGFFALGPDFETGWTSVQTRSQIDVCRTVAELLGIDTPLADGGLMLEILRNPVGLTPVGQAPGGTAHLSLEAFPNPFNPTVTIRLDPARGAPTAVDIVDSTGRHVRRLGRWTRSVSPLTLSWDGRRDDGEHLSAGIYVLRVTTAGESHTRKLTLLK